jgi:DNA invertase Pin-like site-specific DNA recombinase
VWNILLALLASLAKVEAQKISQRTKAGMARAKAAGRPRTALEVREEITSRLATGASVYPVAKELGIDRHTVKKYA